MGRPKSRLAHGTRHKQGRVVRVVTRTWQHRASGLFDFKAKRPHVQKFTVQGPARFVRSGASVKLLCEGERIPQGGEPLLQLKQRSGALCAATLRSPSGKRKHLWRAIHEEAKRERRIKAGDLIKLGRVKIRLRQVVPPGSDEVQPELGPPEDAGDAAGGAEPPEEGQPEDCRICLQGAGSGDDRLIRPCGCKGSVRAVHLGCLRAWVRRRLQLGDPDADESFFYRPVACELCKATFPAYVRAGDERVLLVQARPRPPFAVLERPGVGTHVVSLIRSRKVGTGRDAHVRIVDRSISRSHGLLRFQQGAAFLEDAGSKFGTFVAVRKRARLKRRSALSLQVGRTLLSIAVT